MVIGTGTANADYSGQVSGEHSPAVPVTTSSDSSRYVSVPPDQAPSWLGGLAAPQTGSIASVPVPQGGAVPQQRQAQAGGLLDWDETALYSVYVTSNDLLNIPGVNGDCGLPDSIYTRRVICSKDPSHFSYIKSGNSCGDPGCSRHWVTWARQAADRIGMRIDGFWKASRTRYPPRKIILSIEDDNPVLKTWRARGGDRGAVKRARAYFVRQAEQIGCTGGSMVIHLWRTNDNVPGYIQGQKKWDFVRSQGDRWREFVKFSPHAHIIGYGYLKKPDKDKFEYKNMGPLNTRDEVEAVSYYNLSHAPIGKGITAVIYFGCCSYGKLKCTFKTVVHSFAVCPECGSYLVFEDTTTGFPEYVTHARSEGSFVVVKPPP